MMPPVLTEPVRLPRLPGVAVAVRAILSLDERRIDRPTRARPPQRRHHRGDRAEDHPSRDLDDPALLAGLLHRGVGQPLRSDLVGGLGTTALAGPGRRDRLAVSVEDRLLIGRIAVGGDQVHQPAPCATLEVVDHRRDVLAVRSPGTTLMTNRLSASIATW